MPRSAAFRAVGICALTVCAHAACGGRAPREAVTREGGAEVTPADAGFSGDVITSDGQGGEGGGQSQDACAEAPPPSPPAFPGGPPADIGCYAKTETGWQRVPCNCELPLANPGHTKVEVQLTLTVSPESVQPVLSGSPAVELRFEDRDSSWYQVWVRKLGSRTDVAATHADGFTTIRLGTRVLTLDPVPLAACESRRGQASVTGIPWATLEMRATAIDNGGQEIPPVVSSCVNIPRPGQ
jgi:hypothetical protein